MFNNLEPQIRRSLLVLFITGLLFWCSIGSQLPTIPLYAEDMGGTKQQIGLVMGSFAIGLLIFRQPLGWLADNGGLLLVVKIGVSVAATAPIGYLLANSIPMLMAIRAFHGISIAAYATGSSALVAELSPPRQRGEILGYMTLVNPLGVAIGPAIGGLVMQEFGYQFLFLMASAFGIVGLICAWQIPFTRTAQSPATAETAKISKNESFWRLVASPRLLVPTAVMLSVGLVFGTLSTFMPLFIKDAEMNMNAGWFYTAAAISSFISRFLAGRASDRYGRGLFVSGSLVLYIAAMAILCTATASSFIIISAILEGAGAGILIPTILALVADRSTSKERGRVFALCIGGFDLGMAFAGPTLGAFADALGYRSMFALACTLATAALVLFVTKCSKDTATSLRYAIGREKDWYALNE